MNKALINKILIVALTLIWGFVGYSFFWPKSANVDPLTTNNAAITPKEITSKKDAFELLPLERDPYLNARTSPIKKALKIPKDRPRSNSKNTKTVWPNIAFFGFVKNNNQSAPLVLLKINNQLKRLRQGEKYEEITVQRVYKDSVHIKIGKETKNFIKN